MIRKNTQGQEFCVQKIPVFDRLEWVVNLTVVLSGLFTIEAAVFVQLNSKCLVL